MQTEATLQQLNLCFCELVATIVDGNAKPDSKVVAMLDRVDAHVSRILGGETATAAHPLGQTLTAAAYISLVPTIWALLSRSGEASAAMLEAVLAHYATLSASSALKRPALELITRVLTVCGLSTVRS